MRAKNLIRCIGSYDESDFVCVELLLTSVDFSWSPGGGTAILYRQQG